MMTNDHDHDHAAALFRPLRLPCGAVLKNRIVKSAMSDSLGDGRGNPTPEQHRLYQRWAEGGAAMALIGEVQGNPQFAEKPGNLVLKDSSPQAVFRVLADSGLRQGMPIWVQLGHAGAMAHPPIGTPRGPSALDLPGLSCAALSLREITALPAEFARTARLARQLGFGGVQIHAAHGFLLSQFLSPLFNQRQDAYGGDLQSRMRLLLEVTAAVRQAVGSSYPVGIKLNATDQMEGGLHEAEVLQVIEALDHTRVDLIEISGGTYFPGTPSSSDRAGGGPYFVEFAARARKYTSKPLQATGGFKTLQQAADAVQQGHIDAVGLARALVLDPDLPNAWRAGSTRAPEFPRFSSAPEGGITAWYTLRLAEIGEDRSTARLTEQSDLNLALACYENRDADRVSRWNARFGGVPGSASP